MSDSCVRKTSVKESELAEQESKCQEDEITKTLKKRMIDTDEDEDPKNQSLKLKKAAKEPKARKIQFERTEENDDDNVLPLVCSICREPFLDPVVTKCNHYFCKYCALKHYEKSNQCFLCNQPTLGIFNTAMEIKKMIAKVREKSKAMVKEVKTMVEKAGVIVNEAEAVAAESAEMVDGVETLVGIMETFGPKSVADPLWYSVIKLIVENIAANARDKAEKATEMVQQANATMEAAMANMAKAFALMKTVMWNV